MVRNLAGPRWIARSLAGPAQGGRRPGLEGGGPKTGKVATNPGVGSGPNLGTTRSWSNAARKLEKRGSRQRPAAADDWKKSVFKYHKYCVEDGLSVDTPECRSGVSFLPAPADLPSHWLPRRSPPPLPVAPPAAPSRRSLGSSSPPTPTRRPTGCPAGRSFPSASREFLPADADPPPPGATGFDWLPRRSPPPLPVAAPAAPSRRTLGSSSPPTPTRRLPGPPVSIGCYAGLFFPPAIPIDPPVSPFAGPPRRTGGVCLPFGRNGGRKCRSRLEYCAEFPSFVTPKHQYHEKPPPRTLCVCGLLQCSAGRMLRA